MDDDGALTADACYASGWRDDLESMLHRVIDVANLSLMALGSSAPEILLSCIELFVSTPPFTAGELGPGTMACVT